MNSSAVCCCAETSVPLAVPSFKAFLSAVTRSFDFISLFFFIKRWFGLFVHAQADLSGGKIPSRVKIFSFPPCPENPVGCSRSATGGKWLQPPLCYSEATRLHCQSERRPPTRPAQVLHRAASHFIQASGWPTRRRAQR